MVNKYKRSFLNNCYEWLFSEEERRPIGYIVVLFLTILISTIVALFIVAVDRYIEGWVNYLWS